MNGPEGRERDRQASDESSPTRAERAALLTSINTRRSDDLHNGGRPLIADTGHNGQGGRCAGLFSTIQQRLVFSKTVGHTRSEPVNQESGKIWEEISWPKLQW
jgi:hypothetical protein